MKLEVPGLQSDYSYYSIQPDYISLNPEFRDTTSQFLMSRVSCVITVTNPTQTPSVHFWAAFMAYTHLGPLTETRVVTLDCVLDGIPYTISQTLDPSVIFP